MSRIVVLGDVMVDVVAQLGGPIAPGSDAPSRNSFHGGGQAANTAAWLAAAGERPLLVGRVGDDAFGRESVVWLERLGVETRVTVDPELPTGACVVLVAPGGERTMLPDAGANDALGEADLPDELVRSGDHLHVAGYALLRAGSRPAARAAIGRAVAAGMTVSLDPSSVALLSPEFLTLAAGAGLLLPNAEEAAVLAGEGDPEQAARLLAGRLGEVVVTLGGEGALWSDGTELRRCEARPVEEVRDSTGAGDAFAAGLLAARLRGATPEEALAEGCRLAARAVTVDGARPQI